MDVDSQKRSLVGVILTIIVALYVFYLLSIFVFNDSMESELHILPDGYIGKVFVLFDVTGYEKIKYEKRTRIYKIPSSGILVTKSPKNTGWIDASRDISFKYKSDNKFLINAIVLDSLNYPKDSSQISVFEYGYEGSFKYPLLIYMVDTFANATKKDTYRLRKSILKNHYPDLDI